VIPLLPRKGSHLFSRVLGSLAFHADRRGRTTAIENLTLIFGEEKSESEIHRIARDSYRYFAQTVVDHFWSSRLTRDNYETYCEIVVEDPEAAEKARETGAIWVTPHYSNFEWISIVLGFRDYRFTIVAQDFKNSSLTDIYKKNREVTGHKIISQRGAIVRLLKSLKRGGHAAFLTDLTIKPTKAATLIDCFGKKTCVTSIHAELMKRTGLTVMPGLCIPRSDGPYLLKSFKPLKFGPDDNAQTIAQACWNIFEPHIRENPAPWLWMYKHWRYLPSGEEDYYPDYANRHEGFDALQARIAKRNATENPPPGGHYNSGLG
jgi:lauroyl/myristoyl acyltransferase